MFLTNRTRSFHNTAITENGISDHHKLITSFFSSHFERIPPEKVQYRNYRKLDVTHFLKGPTVQVIIFWNFTIFWYRSDSSQVKRNLISTIANLVYELPYELPNDLRLRILGN